MALGIDIYRYQTVTDWNAVKRHGVSFVYVKGSDGGKPAQVRADAQVRGAQGVGLPVGLYHYAQLSPSPEAQADTLTAEVQRLDATGLPPALDLEDPHRPGGVARDFAHRFLLRLRGNGFSNVTLYANTSMLAGIAADTIGVPDTVVWAAAYGPDDGRRHDLTYRGRVDIHQYTSAGAVPGITGRVDLNQSLTELPGAYDMALSQEDVNRVAAAVWEQHRPHLDPNNGLVLPMWMWTVGANMGAWAGANRPLPTISVSEIVDGVARQFEPVVERIVAQHGIKIDAKQFARDLANEIGQRMVEDPDVPVIGPASGTETES